MTLILFAIVTAAIIAKMLLYFSSDGDELRHLFSGLFGLLLAIAAGIGAVAYSFAAWSWFAAEYKTDIINREYGTTYTREEVFYASDVIDTLRQLERKRYEINGDLMRDGVQEEQKP
jgi:hypothetical protein